MRRFYQRKARVRDRWHTGIRYYQDGAAAGGVDKLRDTPLLIVIEIGHHLPGDLNAERGRQVTSTAGILRSNHICASKSNLQPLGSIVRISQRGCGYYYTAGELNL